MTVTPHSAPHIRSEASNLSIMLDMVLALAAVYAVAIYHYGPRALVLCLWSIFVCLLCDCSCTLLRYRRIFIKDLSPIVTGMILPLLFPATISYGILAIADLFAILLAKQVFGGFGQNVFNPAAAGFVFAGICWPEYVFYYPSSFTTLPVFGDTGAKLVSGSTYILSVGGIPSTDYMETLLGMQNGPMCTIGVIVIVACVLFLLLRNSIHISLALSATLSAALFALLFPRIDVSPLVSVFYELFSTPILFVILFMLTDPVTSPRRHDAEIVYGFLAGIIMMLLSYFSAYHFATCFAVLIMNILSPVLDKLFNSLADYERGLIHEHHEPNND